MTDASEVYVDDDATDGIDPPFGIATWRIIDVNEGGVVAYAGSLEMAILIRDAVRGKYDRPFRVGDRIRTRDTNAVNGFGLGRGMRGVIVSVDGRRIGFLTHEEIEEEDDTYPWWAQPEHIELDK